MNPVLIIAPIILIVIILIIVFAVLYVQKLPPFNQQTVSQGANAPVVTPIVTPSPTVATVASSVSPVPVPAPVPVVAPVVSAAPVLTPIIPSNNFYPFNNGSSSCENFCRGAWGNKEVGRNKNMSCVSGKNMDTGMPIDCSSIQPMGSYGCECKENVKYDHDDGTQNGINFCAGPWESANQKDKNLICVGGIDNINNKDVSCTDTLTKGNYSFFCKSA